jgi:hypothetical protein
MVEPRVKSLVHLALGVEDGQVFGDVVRLDPFPRHL